MKQASIRVGIGGWSYEPWRGTFYPATLAKNAELHYASRQVTAIEINSTFYRLQSPATYAKWHEEVPGDFVFTIKAPRYITHRRQLAGAGESLNGFFASGLDRLGHKLGPILWSLPETARFDPADLKAFLDMLPRNVGEQSVRHAIEVRHTSFMNEDFVRLARAHAVAIVFSHAADYPALADACTDFVYARLRSSSASIETGYSERDLEQWALRARRWAQGQEPEDLQRVAAATASTSPRDVFIFFISGAKERNPAAARRLIDLLHT